MFSHISFFTNQSRDDIHRVVSQLYRRNVDSSMVRYSETFDGSRVIDCESAVYNLRNCLSPVWVNCLISRDLDGTYTVHLVISHAYVSTTRNLKAESFNTLEDAYNGRDTLLLIAYGITVDMAKGAN